MQLPHLTLHLVRQLHQFLGAFAQQPAFRRQRNLMRAAMEQRHAQRILQSLELPGEGGL